MSRPSAKQSDKEAAAIIGFTSAIAAYGAFFIPKSFGTSIAATGGAEVALYAFLGFYVSCIAITWWFYTRRGGLLYDVERGKATPSAVTNSPRRRPAAWAWRLLRRHNERYCSASATPGLAAGAVVPFVSGSRTWGARLAAADRRGR
jgi:hypothetical protein